MFNIRRSEKINVDKTILVYDLSLIRWKRLDLFSGIRWQFKNFEGFLCTWSDLMSHKTNIQNRDKVSYFSDLKLRNGISTCLQYRYQSEHSPTANTDFVSKMHFALQASHNLLQNFSTLPHAITFHFPSPYPVHFPVIKPAFTAPYKKDKLKQPGWTYSSKFSASIYLFSVHFLQLLLFN